MATTKTKKKAARKRTAAGVRLSRELSPTPITQMRSETTRLVTLPQTNWTFRIQRISEFDYIESMGALFLGMQGSSKNELAIELDRRKQLREQARNGDETAAEKLKKILLEERKITDLKLMRGVVEPAVTDDPSALSDGDERLHISYIPERDRMALTMAIEAFSYGFEGTDITKGFPEAKAQVEEVLKAFFPEGEGESGGAAGRSSPEVSEATE